MMSKKLAVLLLFCFSAVVAASDICLPLATPTPTPTPLPACWGAYDADDPRWWDDLVTNDPNTCHCEDSCDAPNEWSDGWQKARCRAGLQFDRAKLTDQCQVKTPAPHWQQPTNGELESSSTDHSNRRPHEDSKTSDKNTPDKKTPDKKTSTRQTSCSCDAEYEGEALFAVRSHETSSGGLYCDCCYGDDGSNGYVYVID